MLSTELGMVPHVFSTELGMVSHIKEMMGQATSDKLGSEQLAERYW